MTTVLVLVALALGLGIGVLVALRLGARQRVALFAANQQATAQALAQLQQAAAVDREAAINAAVDHSTRVAQQALAAQLAAGRVELSAKEELIGVRLAQVQHDVDERLAAVTELVGQLGASHAESYGRVAEQLASHSLSTRELHQTAAGLRDVLASPKARGQWGERMVDDVLRAAGLREGLNYRRQRKVDGEGRSIPDITFLLPKGHVLYLDVKFPLDAYTRYIQADHEADRERHRVQFLRDVRQRVKELADRRYATDERGALREVLLFIPNEAILQFIHEEDPAIVDEAMGHQLVLCSPLTLFALLVVVRQAYESFVTEQTSEEVLRLLGSFNDQYQRFTEQLDKLGRSLDSTSRAFEELNGVRRRQLERPLGKIEELRVEHGLAADPLLSGGATVFELGA